MGIWAATWVVTICRAATVGSVEAVDSAPAVLRNTEEGEVTFIYCVFIMLKCLMEWSIAELTA